MKKKLLLVFIICSVCLFAQTNKLRFEQISSEQGLSQVSVFHIYQDYLGYIWISTANGLNKWDGYKMKVYKNDPADSTSLFHSHAYGIIEDKKLNLWISAGNILNKYNRAKDSFERYSIIVNGEKVNLGLFAIDYKDRIWISNKRSFVLFDRENNSFTRYIDSTSGKSEEKSNSIPTMYCYEDTIYFSDRRGNLITFDMNTKVYKIIKNFGENVIIGNIIRDSNNIIWASTFTNGLFKYDPLNDKVEHFTANSKNPKYKIQNNAIIKMGKDSNDRIYLGTQTGIDILNRKRNLFESVKLIPTNSKAPQTVLVSHIFIDKSENIWLGTDPNGVYKISKQKNKFKHLSVDDGLPVKVVIGMTEDIDQNMWFGTFGGGIVKFNRKKNSSKIFKHDPNNKNSLSDNRTIYLLRDSNDDIWVGGAHLFGVNKYSSKTNRFIKYPQEKYSSPVRVVQTIYEDSDKNIWMGSYFEGLHKYDPIKDKFTNYLPVENDTTTLGDVNVKTIFEDSFGNFWVGTRGAGLYKMDRENETFQRVILDRSNLGNLAINEVAYIFQDKAESLWIGTHGGLFKYDFTSEKFIKFTEKDGLSNNHIYGILEDDHSNLWISTNHGISKFNYVTNEFKKFTENDGLANNEFAQNSFYKASDGTMFFGGTNGLTYFHPDDIVFEESENKLMLTNFKILNKEVDFRESNNFDSHISIAKSLELTYKDYFFEFEFASLNFVNNKDLSYAYKMDGFDKDWVYTNPSKRYASYTNLDAGNYIFKATIVEGNVPNESIAVSIPVYIAPPFWETWWFYLLMIITIALLIYTFIKFRINKILELERLRVGIASDLHDDIGSTLTKLALKADVTKGEVKSESASKSLDRISEMSRYAVSTMSDIVWSIDSRNDSYESMLNKMKDFAFGLLADKDIVVEFESEGFESSKKAPIEFRQNLYLIFKESINNVIKHSNANRVTIKLKLIEKEFSLYVFDNGTNFEVSEFKVGHGLRNMKLRAKKINAKIEYKNDNGFIITVLGKLI